jgi:hypothetical protein
LNAHKSIAIAQLTSQTHNTAPHHTTPHHTARSVTNSAPCGIVLSHMYTYAATPECAAQ